MVNVSVSSDDPILFATGSFTLCLRFYLEVLGTAWLPKRGSVIQIPGFLQLLASYPNRRVRHKLQTCQKSRRIGCVILHCKLQRGITQPIFQLFRHICICFKQCKSIPNSILSRACLSKQCLDIRTDILHPKASG